MKLKNSEVASLHHALSNLESCRFTASIGMRLSWNLHLLKDPFILLQSTERRIRGESKNPQEALDNWNIFLSEDFPAEVALKTVKMDDLQIEKNGIPVGIVSSLFPIIEDIEEAH